MIGNGCSANQAVPALLNDPKYSVGSLTQIVRSQHYILKPLPRILYILYRLLSFNFIALYFVRLIVVLVLK